MTNLSRAGRVKLAESLAESLWAKPLPGKPKSAQKEQEKEAGARKKMPRNHDDDVDIMEEDLIDVDAELESADIVEEVDAETETLDDDFEPEIAAEYDEEASVETADEQDGDDDIEEDEPADLEPEYDDDETMEGEDATDSDYQEEVVAAVDDDEDEEGATDNFDGDAYNEEKEEVMAEKKKMSISDHVRAEIERRKKSGGEIRGKDIIATLGKRGVTASAAQVSQLMKKAGITSTSGRGRKPGSGKKKPSEAVTTITETTEKSRAAMRALKKKDLPARKPAAGAATEEEPRRITRKTRGSADTGFRVPMGKLQAAEEFVAACGGSFKAAAAMLQAAEQLSQTFGDE